MGCPAQLDFDPRALEGFCRSRGIRKLSLFGSALREDFRPGESDLDILAEFEPGALRGVGLDFFPTGPNWKKSSEAKWTSVPSSTNTSSPWWINNASRSMSRFDPAVALRQTVDFVREAQAAARP
jgi:Nucleotidyltransferase domain